MLTMIDTRVSICPICKGALDRGFKNEPGHYQGHYFFCVNCHTQFHIEGEGQAENELLVSYVPFKEE